MILSLLLSQLACAPEYNPSFGEYENNSNATSHGQNSLPSNFHFGCDASGFALPVQSSNMNEYIGVCGLENTGDDIDTPEDTCEDSLNEHFDNQIKMATEIFLDNIDLLNPCHTPMTIFGEFKLQSGKHLLLTDEDQSDGWTESGELLVTFDNPSATVYDTYSDAYESGVLTGNFPVDHFFLNVAIYHSIDSEIKTMEWWQGIAAANTTPEFRSTNTIVFDRETSTAPMGRFLNVNELDYQTPCSDCGYILTTSEDTMTRVSRQMLDSVVKLLEIDDEQAQTLGIEKRKARFFAPSEE